MSFARVARHGDPAWALHERPYCAAQVAEWPYERMGPPHEPRLKSCNVAASQPSIFEPLLVFLQVSGPLFLGLNFVKKKKNHLHFTS
ncbi:hypothetical protein LOK49_LG15G02390 [Camellia lanceoleosa]|uniref:Uncharacterized protein n=1 Tax=Camellia lanceoleosa TaxID=1840588 RepID=A0ACC0F8N6_9ERIC|nr:hypothetical protein LOK49_LG15G02390 [Camellia lanceoleosa]